MPGLVAKCEIWEWRRVDTPGRGMAQSYCWRGFDMAHSIFADCWALLAIKRSTSRWSAEVWGCRLRAVHVSVSTTLR